MQTRRALSMPVTIDGMGDIPTLWGQEHPLVVATLVAQSENDERLQSLLPFSDHQSGSPSWPGFLVRL
jgi:hypothetical protein